MSSIKVTPELKTMCADLVLADAIVDMAAEEGITREEARKRILTSSAYAALYDLETGLWGLGPDYFRSYLTACEAS